MYSFVQRYLDGTAKLSDIDDWIDQWHSDSSCAMDLHEYLGLTKQEYIDWLAHPDELDRILATHNQPTEKE